MVKVCCIFNAAAHYCKSIYSLMDVSFDCKFVFGDESPSVKRFDVSILKDVTQLRYRSLGSIVIMPGMLKYAFKGYNYYIITPATNSISMWLFLLILKLFPRKKVYTWTHGMYGYESKRQLFFKRLQYDLCDGEFVYGDYAIKLMTDKGYSHEKLFPIHNSLDYDEQLKLRNSNLSSNIYKEHFGNDNPVLVVIGRLNRRKKLPMLLKALSKLKKQNERVNVVVIGDGEERDFLIDEAKRMGVSSQLWLYGACYDERKNAELLYNSDICVMPGDIGLTAIHSLMFGVPVITHNAFEHHGPEFESVIPGETGLFFEHDNVDSLVDNIKQWLTSGRSRECVREACYKVIDQNWNPYYQIGILKQVLK